MLSRALQELKWLAFRAVERMILAASRVERAPFPDPAQFSWSAVVERATPAIRAELANVQATRAIPNFQDVSADQAGLTDDDRWKTYFLYGYGRRYGPNCARCPETVRALGAIPGMRTAMFSILAPGKVIPPHRGPFNGVLRYHLGLVVPDGGRTSGIRVGGETRAWEVGQSLIFDDTYEHEAWNHADEQRVVLFVDFDRPLRFPVNLLNRLVLWAIRRSRFVEDALENLRRHDQAA